MVCHDVIFLLLNNVTLLCTKNPGWMLFLGARSPVFECHSEVGMLRHCMKCLRFLFKPRQLSLLDFGTFSCPLLLQLGDDLV